MSTNPGTWLDRFFITKSQLTQPFTMPAANATATAVLQDNGWIVQGDWYFIEGLGALQAGAPSADGFSVPLTNTVAPGNAASGTVAAAGTPVTLSGVPGTGPTMIDVTVGTSGGSSVGKMPAGKVWQLLIKIGTSFNNSATAAVGYSGLLGAVAAGIDLTKPPGVYPVSVLVAWPASAPVVVTVSGAPTLGAAEVLLVGGPVTT